MTAQITPAPRTPSGPAGGDLSGTYPDPGVVNDSHSHTSATAPGGAPTTADYLVGTPQAGLSAEIVVGATPGGELGNTWASPTVDATHSGSTHAATQAAAEATAADALATHEADTTSVHGIANTANLLVSGGALGTPSSGTATNLTGTAAGLTAGTVTTNANLTGDVTSSGNATTIGSGKVTEAMQVLADNTTQNVSTTKHGYAPKAPNDATKYLDGTGAYSTPAGGGSVTKRVPIALDTPDASGNGYPGLTTNNGFTRPRRVLPYFTKDVLGTWEGAIRIPADYASAGKVVCSFVGNATANVFRSIVSTSVVAAAASEDVAYTDETAVDTTFATTANRRVDVSVTLTTTPAAGSTLNVKITHDGAHANDTIAVDVGVWHCEFEYTT